MGSAGRRLAFAIALRSRTIEREVLLAQRDDRRRGVAEEQAEHRGPDEQRPAAGPQRQPDERDGRETAERAAQHHEGGREAHRQEHRHEAPGREHSLRTRDEPSVHYCSDTRTADAQRGRGGLDRGFRTGSARPGLRTGAPRAGRTQKAAFNSADTERSPRNQRFLLANLNT